MARAAISGRLTWRTATLAEARPENATARTLVLDVPGWPGHLAGQHVDVRLTADDGYTAQRSYSMSAPADGERVEITVQSVADGEVSPYLVDVLAVGDAVEVRGPIGGWFVWRPEQLDPVLLVAGGSGVVPLMAMIRARRRSGNRSLFRLIYSVRTPADAYYADELRRRAQDDHGLEVTVVQTRFGADARRITAADLATHGWPAELAPACFVCGPTGFVETVADILVALGHDPRRVRTERFGPS